MAYNFTAASSQSMITRSCPVLGEPITIACWFNRKTNATQHRLVTVDRGLGSVGTSLHTLVTGAGSLAINANSNDGISFAATTTSTTYALNTWNHGCAVFAAANSRSVYLNGGGKTTNTTLRNVTGLANITIGAGISAGGALGQFSDALIAEVGIWNIALTDIEIVSLARGMTCNKIKPQNLVFYAPLIRDLIDTKGGLILTANNGPTVTGHPRVYA